MTKTVYRPAYFRRQAKIWFAVAALLFVVWLVFWFNQGEAKAVEKTAKPVLVSDVNIPKRIEVLDELSAEVPPVNFETIVRDVRSYPDEFKDKKFFSQHKNKWTVQVMDVAEHKVILDYLNGRGDRDKFVYFRYKDNNDKPRYILTYGLLNSIREAAAVSGTMDFRLPNSARAVPEEISRYLTMIDDYERVPEVVHVREEKPRQVNLKPTNKEVAPKPAELTEAEKQAARDAAETAANANQPKAKPKTEAPVEKPPVVLAVPPTVQPVEEEVVSEPKKKKGKLAKIFQREKKQATPETPADDAGETSEGSGQ